jgi:hypothetical protein
MGAQGSVRLMRLTVLKKWLGRPERLDSMDDMDGMEAGR